jgi:hypothetical protein
METATVVSNFIKGKICILNEMFIKTKNTHWFHIRKSKR